MAKTKTLTTVSDIPEHAFFLKYWMILLPVTVVLVLIYVFIFKDLPSPTQLTSESVPQSTQILDRNNKLLYTIYAKKNQTPLPLATIPKSVQQATIAIEDKDFYHHGAIDLRGIARSVVAIAFHNSLQGGSTLTQQLVKNSLLSPERTIMRKIKEVILSFATELIYPKDKILEMYLNQTPYGGTAWGIEAASQMYFGKKAKDLDLAESALLAGLPEAPTTNSPFGASPERAKNRQMTILTKMHEQGYISSQQQKNAGKEELHYQRIANVIQAPHFVLYVKRLLEKQYGEKMVTEGGLKVKTTLDLDTQHMAEASVAAEIESLPKWDHVSNGAALITNPATGEILGMVGSKDYFDNTIDGNVNITTSLRQPGSSIKPINYAAGLGNGYTAATPFVDQPSCFPPGTKNYCPFNYDRSWHGVQQMRFALANSFNMPAVKMLKLNGVSTMIATASAMGITSFTNTQNYGLALTLGGAEATMLEMATAYGVFANGGYRIDLHPILTVTDRSGHVLDSYTPPQNAFFGKKVLPKSVAFIISDILADNGARSLEFGLNNSLHIAGQVVSAKTGTTNDIRDNWTIGYTPSFVVATWVGNNDNSPMLGLTSGITGAAPIWHDIMSELLKNKTSQPPQKPDSVIQKFVCSTSGLLPQSDGNAYKCPTRLEYFIRGTEPTTVDPGMTKAKIDKTTQDLAQPDQTDNIEEKDEAIVTDPLGDRYCVTCNHPTPAPAH